MPKINEKGELVLWFRDYELARIAGSVGSDTAIRLAKELIGAARLYADLAAENSRLRKELEANPMGPREVVRYD